jgi:hypothetical protein
VAAGVVLAWAFPAVLLAAPAPSDKDKAAAGPAEKIRAALNAPVTVKIDKQPLGPAVEILREKTKVNFVLDTMTIQNTFGWPPDQSPTAVEVDLKDVKLKSALRTVLTPYGLSYAVIGDTVVITTEDMAIARQMKQRVNVEFDKVEFATALKQLSRDTGANLILDSRVDKEAKNPVSLELDDVPLETAVRLLSEMAGLKPVRVGNVLFVTDKKNAAEMRQDPDLSGPPAQPGNPYAERDNLMLWNLNRVGGANTIVLPNGPPAGGPVALPAVPADPVKVKAGEDKPDDGKQKADPPSEKGDK